MALKIRQSVYLLVRKEKKFFCLLTLLLLITFHGTAQDIALANRSSNILRVVENSQIDNKLIPVEKPWREIKHTQDAYKYNCNTTMDWLWDGRPDRYPRVFHTAKGSTMPHTFTFDFGRIYSNLAQMEQWGRQDPANRPFSNPVHFEVWGIADDITNSVPDLPGDSPNWKEAMIDKGWTLLADVTRKDDGIDGVKVDLIKNAPPVRFIRIRILETATDNPNGFSHMSELSFWYEK